jgi:hypothetical protein
LINHRDREVETCCRIRGHLHRASGTSFSPRRRDLLYTLRAKQRKGPANRDGYPIQSTQASRAGAGTKRFDRRKPVPRTPQVENATLPIITLPNQPITFHSLWRTRACKSRCIGSVGVRGVLALLRLRTYLLLYHREASPYPYR